MRRFKRKLKNIIIGWTFAIAFVACVAAVASIGEPDFTWDKLPATAITAGVSVAYIALAGYANSDAYANKCSARGKAQKNMRTRRKERRERTA